MNVCYRAWYKDRENPLSRMQIPIVKFHVVDILETAHDILMNESDSVFECYRVDLIEICNF